MAHPIDEVVQKLKRLQLVHGMSAVNEAIQAYSGALDDDARALFFSESADNGTLSYSNTDTGSSTSARNNPVACCSSGGGDPVTHDHLTKHNTPACEWKQTTIADHSLLPPRSPKSSPSLVTADTLKKPGRNPLVQDTPPSSPTPPHSLTSTELHPLAHSLDTGLIKIRFPDRPFKREIHSPPHGHVGSAGRWYVVCVGRRVGVFNEWNDVNSSVTGVSREHQHRANDEESAHRTFKTALEAGKVELVNSE